MAISQRALELGFSVDAVDFSSEAIRIAKEQPGREGIRWYCSALDTFDLPDRFDVVMTIDVLFHIVDDEVWQRTVERLGAFVAPDGTLVIQEHLVDGADDEPSPARSTCTGATLDRYRQALPGWDVVSHDKYAIPASSSWKDLVVFRRAP